MKTIGELRAELHTLQVARNLARDRGYTHLADTALTEIMNTYKDLILQREYKAKMNAKRNSRLQHESV